MSKPNNLKPSRRLLHRWQFLQFFNKSESLRLSSCVIFRIPNIVDHFRLGITLKAKGSSTQRNKVKRQIREIFRKNQTILGACDYNVVIPAETKMDRFFIEKLKMDLHSVLNRFSQQVWKAQKQKGGNQQRR